MEPRPITSEKELADAILQLVDEETSQVTSLPRLQMLYRMKKDGDIDVDLSRCGTTLEALFSRNVMSAGSGSSYTFGRSNTGVPQIERVQEYQENMGSNGFNGFNGPPFPYLPMGAPRPLIPSFVPPGMFFQPPPPLFPPRQPQEFVPRKPQTPQPTVQTPKFVRMSQLYRMVNDQVQKSKSGRISIEMLFDNVQDVLKEENRILNQIQSSDWTGVIERGIDSEDIEAVLSNGILYKPGSEPPNVAQIIPVAAASTPAAVPKPTFGERNLVSEMQKAKISDGGEARRPDYTEDHRYFHTQSRQMDMIKGFSQPMTSNSELSLVNTTTDSSFSEMSRAASRFGAPITTFPVDDHVKEEKMRATISWGYIEDQRSFHTPADEKERAILAGAVKKCRNLWEKRVTKLPELIFLLKSHWIHNREFPFTDLNHGMFDFLFGNNQLDWEMLGLVPDDMAPLRMYVVANHDKKTVQVNEHVQLVSIYQLENGSLPAQVYDMMKARAEGDKLTYHEIINNTQARCDGGWEALEKTQCYDLIDDELFLHPEIFVVNAREGLVQLRMPMAHIVIT